MSLDKRRQETRIETNKKKQKAQRNIKVPTLSLSHSLGPIFAGMILIRFLTKINPKTLYFYLLKESLHPFHTSWLCGKSSSMKKTNQTKKKQIIKKKERKERKTTNGGICCQKLSITC